MMAGKRPKKGQRYVVSVPFPAHVLTMWHAPFTGGEERVLPAGLEFLIETDPPPHATAAIALPDRYEDWECKLVSQRDRNAEKYGGYYLVVPFKMLDEKCVRVLPSQGE
jgi:hypothetical protein